MTLNVFKVIEKLQERCSKFNDLEQFVSINLFKVIEQLRERCSKFSDLERFVSILFDEMSIKEDLVSRHSIFYDNRWSNLLLSKQESPLTIQHAL